MQDQKLTEVELRDEVLQAHSDSKRPFVAPKLRFVKPELVRHGDVNQVTAQFIGPITP
jgi:hypothetical protein